MNEILAILALLVILGLFLAMIDIDAGVKAAGMGTFIIAALLLAAIVLAGVVTWGA